VVARPDVVHGDDAEQLDDILDGLLPSPVKRMRRGA